MLQTLPIGIQTFAHIRKDNMLYVDKSGRLLELIETGRRYFLSRPRRFGKSLTLSTLEAMFCGRCDLFSGLAAEQWVRKQADHPAPVLRFDMSTIESFNHEDVRLSLKDKIKRRAEDFNIPIRSETLGDMFIDLIRGIHKAYGHVVVLIDEYDKPILDNISDIRKANDIREVMRSFYSALKSSDEFLRFVFITGISKFSKAGIFSSMNNLLDISMTVNFGDIVGYSQQEFEESFRDWIDNTAKKMNLNHYQLVARLKDYYDGFSFDGFHKLYNPFSILNCLSTARFGNFWYISGSPTFIVRYMKNHSISDPDEYQHFEVSPDFADNHEIEYSTPESFLYQSGYLTIEKWEDDLITLNYPNEEVRKSISRIFLDDVYHVRRYITLGNRLWEALQNGNISQAVELYNTAISAVPYDDFANRNEFWYRSLFIMLLRGAGIISYAEIHTHKGRCDLLIQFNDSIIVFEFKFASLSSEVEKMKLEGTTQMEDREYSKGYMNDGRQVISAVLVADDQKRILIETVQKTV